MAAVRLSVIIIIISVTIVGTSLPPLISHQQSYARTADGEIACNFACGSVSEASKFTSFPQAVVLSKIPVGTNPVGIAFNPYNGICT